MALKILAVALGGAVGATLRYGLSGLGAKITDTFPLGTLAANMLGSIVIGFAATLLLANSTLRPEVRLLVIVGILGGFTTFSSYAWETLGFANDGQYAMALGNVLLNNVLALGGVWLGHVVAQQWFGAS